MKKIVYILMMFFLVVSISIIPVSSKAEAKGFNDVPSGFWAKDSIQWAVDGGIVHGYPDGTFKPNKPVTKAEFITMVMQIPVLVGHPIDTPFTDVAGHWAQKYIEEAAGLNTFDQSLYNGKLNPDKPLSRQEMASYVVRALNIPITQAMNFFADADQMGKGYERYVATANINRLISGYSDNTFRPDKPLTRAEAVAMIQRVAEAKSKGLFADSRNNLVLFGMKNIVQFPVTVKSDGLDVTIHSIYAYNMEESKPIVDKYDLTFYKDSERFDQTHDPKYLQSVPLYQAKSVYTDYTVFFVDMTLKNTGSSDVALDFYDLNPDFELMTKSDTEVTFRPDEYSQYRKGLNRTDYTDNYRIKPGQSFRTHQAFVFQNKDLTGYLSFLANANNLGKEAELKLADIPEK